MERRTVFMLTGLSGALCVALGAMGAHALESRISPESLHTFETGIKYHFYHTLALFMVAVLPEQLRIMALKYIAPLLTIGISLFSFSLYFLALRPVLGIEPGAYSWIGIITPFGGVSFILAWLMLFYAALKQKIDI